MSHTTEKCQAWVSTLSSLDLDPRDDAIKVLQEMCEKRGMDATEITLVSKEPWTEPLDGLGPNPNHTLYFYEATAVPRTTE